MADGLNVKAAGVRLKMPTAWWELPLAGEDRDAAITAVVARQRPDLSTEARDRLAAGLAVMAGAAHRQGAIFCAQTVLTNGARGLVPASVLVRPLASLVQAETLTVHAAALARRGFPRPADPPPTECSVVNLPAAGPGIRVQSDGRANGVNGLCLQFFVPMPGAGATVVVTFSSPTIAGAEASDGVVELFDAMARTIRFVEVDGGPLTRRRHHPEVRVSLP